jgi:hypothetical protein
MSHLLGLDDAADTGAWVELEDRLAPPRFGERGRQVMPCDRSEVIAFG